MLKSCLYANVRVYTLGVKKKSKPDVYTKTLGLDTQPCSSVPFRNPPAFRNDAEQSIDDAASTSVLVDFRRMSLRIAVKRTSPEIAAIVLWETMSQQMGISFSA